MAFSFNENLNNLNHFWQALKADESHEMFTHQSWPNKYWQADFNVPDTISAATLPLNKVVSTIIDLAEPKRLGLAIKNQLVIMNLKLDQAVNSTSGQTYPNIVKLSVGDDISHWVKACSEAFGYEIDTSVIQSLLNNSNASIFSYLIAGEVAGTAISYKTGDTLGIHQLGTAPDFRKMGIALALMEHILAQAVSQKCQFVSLQASQAGLHMYEKLGFKSMGKLTSYTIAESFY